MKRFPLEFRHKGGWKSHTPRAKMSRGSLSSSEWDSWCAADTAGSHLCLMGQQMEQLLYTMSQVVRPGINRQECRGTLLPWAPVRFHLHTAWPLCMCSWATGTREAKWTGLHLQRSFTEQGQVSQSPLHKYNPLEGTTQCSSHSCYLFPCGTIWMELSLVDLAQARRKNTKTAP